MLSPANVLAAPVAFAVKAQSLNRALVALAVEANISISTPKGLDAVQAPALHGRMRVEDALDALLEGSGYGYRRIDAATFEIVRQADARPAFEGPDIVVTASLQPQSLSNAPGSISVLSGDALRNGGINGAADIAADAAGMIVTNLGPGRDKIILRGLSDGVFSGQAQSTIGVYLGDVRLTDGAPDPDLRLTDMNAVEILRGPQGVRYGAGAEAGVYRMAPNAPDPDRYLADVQATAVSVDDGGADTALDLVANVPVLSGRGAVRGIFYRDVAPGWLDNPGLGLRDVNRTRREGGRAAAAFALRGSWSLSFQGVSQAIDSADSQYLYAGSAEQSRTAKIREPHDNDFALAAMTIKGALSFAEFVSTSALVSHEVNSLYDASGALTAFGVPGGDAASLAMDSRYKFYSEEVRLRGAASRMPWAIGAFASYGEADVLDAADDVTASASAYRHTRNDEVRELALFGELTYPVTDAFAVTLGARAFTTELRTRATTTRASLGTEDVFTGWKRQSDFAPKIEITYRPASGALYYFLASEGYRTGGFNTGGRGGSLFTGGAQPFRAYGGDELWNLEIGTKRRFLGGRLSVHAALFDEAWKNVQSDQLLADGLPFSGNLGDAHVYGMEAEGDLNLSQNLRAHAALSLNESEIAKTDPSFPAPPESALPGAPHVVAGASLSYVLPLKDYWTVNAEISGRYVGPSNITFADDRRTDVGDYGEASFRAGLSHKDWSITGFIDNAFDERGATFSYGNPLLFGSERLLTPLTPRTIGVTVRKAFRSEQAQ